MRRSAIVVAVLALGLWALGAGGAQAESVNKVGVIVRLDSPGVVLDEPAVLAAIVRQTHQILGEASDRIELIEQEALLEAQRALDIFVHERSSSREIQRLSRRLGLSRLVIVRVEIADRFRVIVESTVFNARGERIAASVYRTGGRELEPVLDEAIRTAMRQILPALL